MSIDVQKYNGRSSFGLLEVDKVAGVSSGRENVRAAPWVQKIRPAFEENFAEYTLYCSNRGASFNEIEVKDETDAVYRPHVFIWRNLRQKRGKGVECTYTVRVFSGEMMKELVDAAVKEGKCREIMKKQGNTSITSKEVSISVTNPWGNQNKTSVPGKVTEKIDLTDVLKPYAIACAMNNHANVQPLMTALKTAVDSM